MTQATTRVSSLVRPKALTRIQAETLRDEIAAGFQHLDSDITVQRRKCLLFQQGDGWKPLGYKNLKACVGKVFGFSRQQFYQLVAAAEIEKDIGIESSALDSPPSGRALSPLKNVDRVKRAEVFQDAVQLAEKDEKKDKPAVVSQRHVKAAVKKMIDLAGNGQKGSEKVILPRDGKGASVEQPQLRAVFEARAEVQSILSGLAPFTKRIQAVLDGAAGSAYVRTGPKLAMAGLRHEIKKGCPYVPCPHCKGPGCEECEGRGWWTQAEYTAAAKAK